MTANRLRLLVVLAAAAAAAAPAAAAWPGSGGPPERRRRRRRSGGSAAAGPSGPPTGRATGRAGPRPRAAPTFQGACGGATTSYALREEALAAAYGLCGETAGMAYTVWRDSEAAADPWNFTCCFPTEAEAAGPRRFDEP
jgi:hypothetical protein